jgi:hypothetical protein
MLRHILLFGNPLRALYTKNNVRKGYLAKRNELGYSNNYKDWAIRMLTT